MLYKKKHFNVNILLDIIIMHNTNDSFQKLI